jgi:hypothetical protein
MLWNDLNFQVTLHLVGPSFWSNPIGKWYLYVLFCTHTHIWCETHACGTHPIYISPTPNVSVCVHKMCTNNTSHSIRIYIHWPHTKCECVCTKCVQITHLNTSEFRMGKRHFAPLIYPSCGNIPPNVQKFTYNPPELANVWQKIQSVHSLVCLDAKSVTCNTHDRLMHLSFQKYPHPISS